MHLMYNAFNGNLQVVQFIKTLINIVALNVSH